MRIAIIEDDEITRLELSKLLNTQGYETVLSVSYTHLDVYKRQVLFFGVLISADSDDENSNFSSGITGMNLSAEVLKHQPMVEKYAKDGLYACEHYSRHTPS